MQVRIRRFLRVDKVKDSRLTWYQFQGSTVQELRKAFEESVDDYLEFCVERGESPEKPYSGKFMLRLEPELHKALAIRAKRERKSLNAWVHDALAHATK